MREFQLEVCQQLLGDSACYLLYYVTVTANAGGRIAKLKTDSKHYFLDQQLLLLKNNNNNIYVRFTFQTSYLRNQLHITPTTKSQKPKATKNKPQKIQTLYPNPSCACNIGARPPNRSWLEFFLLTTSNRDAPPKIKRKAIMAAMVTHVTITLAKFQFFKPSAAPTPPSTSRIIEPSGNPVISCFARRIS